MDIILASIFSAVVLVIMGNETTIYLSSAVKAMREFSFTEISIISVIVLAASLLLLRTHTAGATTASTVGTDVMVALVLGGMPLSGGPRSKISAGLLGAVTITVLNSGLAIMGLSTGQIQATRGIVFIVVVLVSSLSYRGKLLPR